MLRETETRAGEGIKRGLRWLVWSPLRLVAAIAVVVIVCAVASTVNGALAPVPSASPSATPSEALPSHWDEWPKVTAGPIQPATPVRTPGR